MDFKLIVFSFFLPSFGFAQFYDGRALKQLAKDDYIHIEYRDTINIDSSGMTIREYDEHHKIRRILSLNMKMDTTYLASYRESEIPEGLGFFLDSLGQVVYYSLHTPDASVVFEFYPDGKLHNFTYSTTLDHVQFSTAYYPNGNPVAIQYYTPDGHTHRKYYSKRGKLIGYLEYDNADNIIRSHKIFSRFRVWNFFR